MDVCFLILFNFLVHDVVLYLIISVVFILAHILAITLSNILIITLQDQLPIAESVWLILLIVQITKVLDSEVVLLLHIYFTNNLWSLVHFKT